MRSTVIAEGSADQQQMFSCPVCNSESMQGGAELVGT